jgi:hypothetical protein
VGGDGHRVGRPRDLDEAGRAREVEAGRDGRARTSLATDWFSLGGRAALEENFTLYMNDQGL